jgi:hypothetical protein
VIKVLLNLLKISGFATIEDDEVEKMIEMEDYFLVPSLVDKVPEDMREGFATLTQQMQMVVQMVSSIRLALESKDPEQLKIVVEELETAGIGSVILKQSCVVATKEVADLQRLLDTWYQDTEDRIERLHKDSEKAEECTQKLALVEDQLEAFGAGSKSKGKSMLIGMADKNDKALMKQCLTAWYGWSMTNAREEEIRAKCLAEIEAMEADLFQKKEASLKNLRASLARSSEEGEKALLMTVVSGWKAGAELEKKERAANAELEALQAKLAANKEAMSGNAKSVMARMSGNKDALCVQLAMETWKKAIEMIKEERKAEEDQRKAEEAMREKLASKKEETKKLMERLAGKNDESLLSMVLTAWVQGVSQSRKDREMEEAINKKSSLFKSLQGRQKESASTAQQKVNEQTKLNLILQCYLAWYTETKVNHVERTYANKIEAKRRQLKSVESLFKSFAKQIDEGLGNLDGGDSSGRGSRNSRHKSSSSKKNISGTNSLPDIHAHTAPASAYPAS